ncbi:Pkinase domain-containing protein [Quillaja saponaria]|uniref:Pkinase domain-containing protein n=1 Tax=Quillaja saponaria TaxID=32244 RepID=A0AAD7PVR4_QUISA|nr:Pkinase domain-containing protein [Quillaja saponaria]
MVLLNLIRMMAWGSWLSVSQGIAEDTSDLVSGFATVGDGLSESVDYPNEYWDRPKNKKKKASKHESNKYVVSDDKGECLQSKTHSGGDFSFPPSLKDGQLVQAGSSKSRWSNNCNAVIIETDDHLDALRSRDSTASTLSKSGYAERDNAKLEEDEKSGTAREDPRASLDDEEEAAVQEQVRQIKAHEEEFEIFNHKIVHRKNRHVLNYVFI